MSDEPRRPQVDLSGAQAGDTSFGDVAGRDIYHGAAAGDLVDLVKRQIDKDSQYRMLDLNARELRQAQLDRQLADIAAELRMQRWLIVAGLLVIIVVIVIAL